MYPSNFDLIIHLIQKPVFLRKDTKDAYQFRIRNLPYPAEVYSVETDTEKQEVVIRTSNKKYYKRFDIPELKNKGLTLENGKVSWVYANNTLVVSVNLLFL